MGACPDTIKRLIEQFNHQSDHLRSPDYNETLIRIDYINPLMTALGWDIDNRQGFAEQYREVVHEDRVKVAGQTKAPDYSFRVGGQRKFFLEAKKRGENLSKETDAIQKTEDTMGRAAAHTGKALNPPQLPGRLFCDSRSVDAVARDPVHRWFFRSQ